MRGHVWGLTWLLRRLAQWRGEDPSYTWQSTGLRFTTGRDYLQGKAEAGYRRSRLQTARGRKFTKPKLVTPRPSADIVTFQRRRR